MIGDLFLFETTYIYFYIYLKRKEYFSEYVFVLLRATHGQRNFIQRLQTLFSMYFF